MIELLRRAGISAIRFYQRLTDDRWAHHCVFTPTCSEYAVLAIRKHGLVRGIFLAAKRIYRCRPGNCGVDFP